MKPKFFVIGAILIVAIWIAATSSHPSAKPSVLDARSKYDLALSYLPNAPNWAVRESVDIVVRYPDSREAQLAAVLIMDNCDHIGPSDFYTLTGQMPPPNMPRAQQIDILMSAFEKRGLFPKR